MEDCIFCRIAAGEIPAKVVYRDDRVMAFRDINPAAPTHILVIPRRHIGSLREDGADDPELWGALIRTARQLAESEKAAEGGFRLVVNTGRQAGQTVPHLHLHLLGGREFAGFG